MKTRKEGETVQQEKAQRTEANLLAIIENADGIVYSIDRDFRYITLNTALKNRLKELFGIDAKPGDRIYGFLEKAEPGEALFWRDIYQKAFSGNHLRFVKEFMYTGSRGFWSFSINPIMHGNEITGLACFARDITDIRLAREKAEAEIQAVNASLEEKVAERTAQLEQANRELEAFSYTVAHDLKAPLRVIGGFVSIVIKNNRDIISDESNNCLAIIQNNIKCMGNLVQDLLEFSRIQKASPALTEVNMHELAEEAIKTAEHCEHNYRCSVKLHPLPHSKGDPGLLKQVWQNLVSNAVKYSAKAAVPYIEIGCTTTEKGTTYYVKDNGAGFDMSMAGKLFNAFHRLHPRSEFEGTGVGLATVHRIITRHGGRIWAEAEVNKGATFYFTLPEC